MSDHRRMREKKQKEKEKEHAQQRQTRTPTGWPQQSQHFFIYFAFSFYLIFSLRIAFARRRRRRRRCLIPAALVFRYESDTRASDLEALYMCIYVCLRGAADRRESQKRNNIADVLYFHFHFPLSFFALSTRVQFHSFRLILHARFGIMAIRWIHGIDDCGVFDFVRRTRRRRASTEQLKIQ